MADFEGEDSANLANAAALHDDAVELQRHDLSADHQQFAKTSDADSKQFDPFTPSPASQNLESDPMAHDPREGYMSGEFDPAVRPDDQCQYYDEEEEDLPANFAKGAGRPMPEDYGHFDDRGDEVDDSSQGLNDSNPFSSMASGDYSGEENVSSTLAQRGSEDFGVDDRPIVGYNPFLNEQGERMEEYKDDPQNIPDSVPECRDVMAHGAEEDLDYSDAHRRDEAYMSQGQPQGGMYGREDDEIDRDEEDEEEDDEDEEKAAQQSYNRLDEDDDEADIQMDTVEQEQQQQLQQQLLLQEQQQAFQQQQMQQQPQEEEEELQQLQQQELQEQQQQQPMAAGLGQGFQSDEDDDVEDEVRDDIDAGPATGSSYNHDDDDAVDGRLSDAAHVGMGLGLEMGVAASAGGLADDGPENEPMEETKIGSVTEAAPSAADMDQYAVPAGGAVSASGFEDKYEQEEMEGVSDGEEDQGQGLDEDDRLRYEENIQAEEKVEKEEEEAVQDKIPPVYDDDEDETKHEEMRAVEKEVEEEDTREEFTREVVEQKEVDEEQGKGFSDDEEQHVIGVTSGVTAGFEQREEEEMEREYVKEEFKQEEAQQGLMYEEEEKLEEQKREEQHLKDEEEMIHKFEREEEDESEMKQEEMKAHEEEEVEAVRHTEDAGVEHKERYGDEQDKSFSEDEDEPQAEDDNNMVAADVADVIKSGFGVETEAVAESYQEQRQMNELETVDNLEKDEEGVRHADESAAHDPSGHTSDELNQVEKIDATGEDNSRDYDSPRVDSEEMEFQEKMSNQAYDEDGFDSQQADRDDLVKEMEREDHSFVDNLSELTSPEIPQRLPSPPEPKDMSPFDPLAPSDPLSPCHDRANLGQHAAEFDNAGPVEDGETTAEYLSGEIVGETKFGVDGTAVTSTAAQNNAFVHSDDEDENEDEEEEEEEEEESQLQDGTKQTITETRDTTETETTETSMEERSADDQEARNGFDQTEEAGNDNALMSMSMEGSFYDDGGELIGGDDGKNVDEDGLRMFSNDQAKPDSNYDQLNDLQIGGQATLGMDKNDFDTQCQDFFQQQNAQPQQQSAVDDFQQMQAQSQDVFQMNDPQQNMFSDNQENFDPLLSNAGDETTTTTASDLDSLIEAPAPAQDFQAPVSDYAQDSILDTDSCSLGMDGASQGLESSVDKDFQAQDQSSSLLMSDNAMNDLDATETSEAIDQVKQQLEDTLETQASHIAGAEDDVGVAQVTPSAPEQKHFDEASSSVDEPLMQTQSAAATEAAAAAAPAPADTSVDAAPAPAAPATAAATPATSKSSTSAKSTSATKKTPATKTGSKTTTRTSTTTSTTITEQKRTPSARPTSATKKTESATRTSTTTTTSKTTTRKSFQARPTSASSTTDKKTSDKTATSPTKPTSATSPTKPPGTLPSYARPITPRKPREAKVPSPEEKKKTPRVPSATASRSTRPQSATTTGGSTSTTRTSTTTSAAKSTTTTTSTAKSTTTTFSASRTSQLARPKTAPTRMTNGTSPSSGTDNTSPTKKPATTRTTPRTMSATTGATKSPRTPPTSKTTEVKSKIGSLNNASHTPSGGNVRITSKKQDFSNVTSRIGSKDKMDHKPGGGQVKIESRKVKVEAKSKIGSLDNATHKPSGGDKKTEVGATNGIASDN